MEKIFITGCAKSGTTLLNRMFQAFSSVYVIPDEVPLYDFAKLLPEQVGEFDFVVGKRSWETVYSCSRLSSKQIENQKELIKKHKIHIVNIVRDGRDVVVSYMNDWGINGCFEWMECVQSMDETIECLVRYENLILNPDSVQADIIDAFGLSPSAKFSEYPVFVKENYDLDDPRMKAQYKPRPLDRTNIGKNKELYKTLTPNDINHFNKLLESNGYTT